MHGIQLKSFLHLALLCATISLSWCGSDYTPAASYVVTGDTSPPGDGYALVIIRLISLFILILSQNLKCQNVMKYNRNK
jgi:hypothetical protein